MKIAIKHQSGRTKRLTRMYDLPGLTVQTLNKIRCNGEKVYVRIEDPIHHALTRCLRRDTIMDHVGSLRGSVESCHYIIQLRLFAREK